MRTLEGLYKSQARAVKVEIAYRMKPLLSYRGGRVHDTLRRIMVYIETIARHPDYHMEEIQGFPFEK